jgi:predicted alpha/beta hydrolase family esterase
MRRYIYFRPNVLILFLIIFVQSVFASSAPGSESGNDSIEGMLEVGELYRQFTYDVIESKPMFEAVIFSSGLIEGAKATCLVVVLVGGRGGAETIGLGRMVDRFVEKGSCLVVQPLAFVWSESQKIVWPTYFVIPPEALVPTEDWITYLVKSILGSEVDIHGEVYLVGFSSSGPAVYSLLSSGKFVSGAVVAGSVFDSSRVFDGLPLKDRRLFVYHSPFDSIVDIKNAYAAREYFRSVGVSVFLREHIYGHSGVDNYSALVEGMSWLKR